MSTNIAYLGNFTMPIYKSEKVSTCVVEDEDITNIIILYPDSYREIVSYLKANVSWNTINFFVASPNPSIAYELLRIVERVQYCQSDADINIYIPENITIIQNSSVITSEHVHLYVQASVTNINTSIEYDSRQIPEGVIIFDKRYDIIIHELNDSVILLSYPTIAYVTDALSKYDEVHMQYSYLNNAEAGLLYVYNNDETCKSNIEKLKAYAFNNVADSFYVHLLKDYTSPAQSIY